MFDLPEVVNLAAQLNRTVFGKRVRHGFLGNKPHKFVWYNRTHEEFARLIVAKTVGEAYTRGKWLFIPADPGYVLVFGEFGGRLLYHPAGSKLPAEYHLWITFVDDSSITATTQMWGAMELFEKGKELERKYIKDMRPSPTDPAFSFKYFSALVDSAADEERSVKGLLTQNQLIPGLGNAIAQDIMFYARLHPKHPAGDLSERQRRDLYDAIRATVDEVTAKGGRSDEHDLFDQPGGYVRIMDTKAAGRACPECGRTIEKIQYLGGACYFCAACQV